MTTCPTSEEITKVVADPETVPTEVLEHVAECPICRRALETADGPVRWDWLSDARPADDAPDDPNPWFLDRMKAAVRYTVTGRPADPGPVIPGYAVEAEIARGGMGVVYRARDLHLGRTVAVKVLPPDAAPDPGRLARFLIEARALAALQHPNVVQLFHAGEVGGRPYLVMEYVPGGTLRQVLRADPWEPADAARLLRTLADATAAAHRLGIIHRDLKPGNVLLTGTDARSTPKIADFGLARFLDAPDHLTAAGEVLGTPEFMAPEQARGETDRLGPETDVWALGATLYETLAGRPPFTGLTRQHTLTQVTSADPIPPARLRPGLPPELCAIALKCLEKQPHRRYRTAADLRADLDRFLAGQPVLARPRSAVRRWVDRAARRPVRTAAWVAGLGALVAGAGVAGADWAAARAGWAAAAAEVGRLRTQGAADRGDLYAARVTLADRALDAGRAADAAGWLAACRPAAEGDPDPRGWEWHYLSNRLRGPARIDLRVTDAAARGYDFPPPGRDAEAISPDRRRRVSVGPDGRPTVHDDDGRVLIHLGVPGAEKIVGLHFSKDGRWLAARTATDGVLVYDGGTLGE